MIHVPLIVHNRRLYPEPLETTAFYDHRDLLPTILDLAGVRDAESYGIGKSIVPVMQDPSKTVQDHTLFSFDDVFFVPPTAPNSHIRAMREGDWTYAVYFSLDGGGGEPPDSGKGGKTGAMAKSMPPPHMEYELYNIQSDPGQMHNLLYGKPTEDVRKEPAEAATCRTYTIRPRTPGSPVAAGPSSCRARRLLRSRHGTTKVIKL